MLTVYVWPVRDWWREMGYICWWLSNSCHWPSWFQSVTLLTRDLWKWHIWSTYIISGRALFCFTLNNMSFLLQTVSISMLLRYAHHQIFVFIGKPRFAPIVSLFSSHQLSLRLTSVIPHLQREKAADCFNVSTANRKYSVLQLPAVEMNSVKNSRAVIRLSGNLFVITIIANSARGPLTPPYFAENKNKII